MSDLQLYELDDISWDEFCHNDDHIVPHPSSGRTNEPLSQNDSRKKPRHEVIGLTSNAGDQSTGKHANQQKDQVLSNRSPKMLEKDSWDNAPDVAFSSQREKAVVGEVSSLPSENTRTSNRCIKSNNIDSIESESCPNGRTLDDKNTAVGENSYSYPLGPISQADDDLSFLDNSCEDKDSNDLLYYSWPEIENFEDVDRMFRSCDSTFGFGPGSEDDLGWLSSSDVIEGSGDGLTSGFKFPCSASSALGSTSASHETSKPKETNISTSNSGIENQLLGYNSSSWSSKKNESVNLSHLSFLNGSSNLECKLVPDKKAEVLGGGVQVEIASNNQPRINNNVVDSMQKKHSKHQNCSEGKRKCGYLENEDTINYTDSHPEEQNLSSGTASTQVNFASAGVLQQKQAQDPDFGYLGGSFSYMHSDYGHSDGSAVHPTLPILKYESNGVVSLSPKDSYASNQVQSMEGSPEPSFQVAAITRNEKVEKLFHQSGVKVENNRDFEGVGIRIPTELGSSGLQECSSINSGLDEISEEAASFHQLQRVMEQLDVRTKLCIRDSLYRLARSAEQRHRHANLNIVSGDDGGTSGPLISKGTNKCTGYVDIETDTNPIDRSIAHLLFHRPSDSAVTPARDSSTLKLPSMIHGSLSSTPVMSDNLISHGEIAPQTDGEVADR
ncbi:protein LNK1-like isoform X2 [Solanum dulcamara]|uniref:protein LNK1-like isoform X2 n=1 Tax=Solanum dulcamara TaxID=45834 RepID=UPI0024868C53|nr:protein LNK1-like isoform X2 [Solanum dulcamara]XP_055816176.1 protein LNK1-like isoform X2 [Solanum dulcamara]